MKNRKFNKTTRFFAIVLTAAMIITALPFSSLAFVDTIVDEEEKLQYLYSFNNSVNAIKKEKPSFIYVKDAKIAEEEDLRTSIDIDYRPQYGSELSEDAAKYLKVLLDSLFNPERGIIQNLFAAISDSETDMTVREIPKGVDPKYAIPLGGKDVVSDLTLADDYKIKVEKVRDEKHPEKNMDVMRFVFMGEDGPNGLFTLENAKKSSIVDVFDLPSGTIDPVIISGAVFPEDDPTHPLSSVKLEDFFVGNAWVQAECKENGELIKYTQNISYSFTLSFYDAMRILRAYTGIDILAIGLAIANPILQNTGGQAIQPEDVLKNTLMVVQYNIAAEMGKFDWAPRFFGDSDNNGKIDSYDARKVLRHSVGLNSIKDPSDLVYSDVDFDGVLTSADARIILRMSVELENMFDKVPEGKTVKIVEVFPNKPEKPENPDNPEIPVDPDKPVDPDTPDTPDTPDKPNSDAFTKALEDFTNGIFDVINGIKGDATNQEGIMGMIKQIQDIVDAARKHNDKA